MIQTHVVSEYRKEFQESLNKALSDLSNHEIIDVKLAVNNEPLTEMETYTAMILYKT
ncbi:sporulation protein Cse60 [Cytobacillus sp. FSL W8-0315]|uniref:sporulation protein Cse60 n=1 Tax=Cytobacillus sp. FSL W8-0315 TaxID=2921600 RepID=UPI0030F4C8EF